LPAPPKQAELMEMLAEETHRQAKAQVFGGPRRLTINYEGEGHCPRPFSQTFYSVREFPAGAFARAQSDLAGRVGGWAAARSATGL
jgi:hypothetical protein